MSPAVRLAHAGDLDGLHSLIERAYRGDSARQGWTHEADLLAGQRTDVAALKAMLADPHQAILLVDVGNDSTGEKAMRGCVNVTDQGQTTAYLGLLSVDPCHQAAGLGRLLVGAAERWAGTQFDALRIEMTVIARRVELIAWYERLGYRLTGERRPFPREDTRFGLPQVDDLDFVVLARTL